MLGQLIALSSSNKSCYYKSTGIEEQKEAFATELLYIGFRLPSTSGFEVRGINSREGGKS